MTELELQKIKLNHIKNNLLIYKKNKDLVSLYEEYLNKIVEFFDFIMDKNDDLFYTIVFNILIEIGYFSFNNTFNTEIDDFSELTIRPGINVISGEGVCRNVACFYEDVFKHFSHYPLKLCCYDQYGNTDKETNIYGNHMINLTKYQDTIYGFDVMNHCLFKPLSKSRLKGVDINYFLYYKIYGDLLIKITTDLELKDDYIDEIETKKMMLSISSKHETINMGDYEKLIANANNFILGKKKIFKSFLEDSLIYKEEIKKKMLLLK